MDAVFPDAENEGELIQRFNGCAMLDCADILVAKHRGYNAFI